MLSDELIPRGQHVMTVCNACRYCEQYCPVFPAMESRLTFREADLAYLANLCHNCGECLHSCQYAPPHEFGLNVPRTLAQLRVKSYEDYCWPGALGRLFRHNSATAGVLTAAVMTVPLLAGAWWTNGSRLWESPANADFYAVVPHGALIALFGGVSTLVLLALTIGLRRFWRDIRAGTRSRTVSAATLVAALRDALTLRHLHADESAVDVRPSWRRIFHHCTFYGFMLCGASTSVAAVYHSGFGWQAPYGYTTLPVVLGTIGGIGLLIGPAGLLALHRTRDDDTDDPAQAGMNVSFITLLWLTSATGLLLLVLRERAAMGVLLAIHLGAVLALLITLPYGKFVHGLYRVAALVHYADENEGAAAAVGEAPAPARVHPVYFMTPPDVDIDELTR